MSLFIINEITDVYLVYNINHRITQNVYVRMLSYDYYLKTGHQLFFNFNNRSHSIEIGHSLNKYSKEIDDKSFFNSHKLKLNISPSNNGDYFYINTWEIVPHQK